MSHVLWEELMPITFMAFATGMDAFSVSLSIGMQKIRLKRIAIIGIIFGLFHMAMPAIGMFLGQIISGKIGHYTALVGGALLVVIGVHMLLSSFNKKSNLTFKPTGIALLSLAFVISIDGFSVGLGLGLSGTRVVVTLLIFGLMSILLTWIGMLLGRKVRGFLGVYSGILGGSILCGFGLNLIFG